MVRKVTGIVIVLLVTVGSLTARTHVIHNMSHDAIYFEANFRLGGCSDRAFIVGPEQTSSFDSGRCPADFVAWRRQGNRNTNRTLIYSGKLPGNHVDVTVRDDYGGGLAGNVQVTQ